MPLATDLPQSRRFVLVETTNDNPGAEIAKRRKAVGMSVSALAKRANLHRNTVMAVESGKTTGTSLGHLESVLSRVEEELGMDTPDLVTSTIELPDGTRVMFAGPADGVAEAAARYMRERDQ